MQTFSEYVSKRDLKTNQIDEVNLKQLMAGLGLAAGGLGTQAADISDPKHIPNLANLNKIARIEAGDGMPSYGGFNDRGKEIHRYMSDHGVKQTGYYPKETARNLTKLQQQDPSWYYDTHDNMLKNKTGQIADPYTGKPSVDVANNPAIKLKPTRLKELQPGKPGEVPASTKNAKTKEIINKSLQNRMPGETQEPPLAN